MKISLSAKSPPFSALAIFATEGGSLSPAGQEADDKAKGILKRTIKAERFDAKTAQILVVPCPAGAPWSHIAVIGLGKAEERKIADFEKMGSALVPALNRHKVESVAIAFEAEELKNFSPEQAAARMSLGMLLNAYRFDKYLTKEPKEKKPTLHQAHFVLKQAQAARGFFATAQSMADAVFFTRDLVSEAPNVLYPESFARIIKKELPPHDVDVQILHMKDLQKLGMGALIAVGQGSVREPKLVSMRYNGGKKGEKPLAFVGKGVTFDTGGISIKPAAGMDKMKWDMGGAAAVTGLMMALASRKAKVNVVGVVALAENMPSGAACRPGDIVTSMSGQTVEILNTDAEGRLILCDALWYCQEKFKPAQIIDLATLTGAVITALGHEYAGLFSNNDLLAARLTEAGKDVGEELWRMPLHDAWDKSIDSPAADMKNIGAAGEAGSAMGAHFLKRFIQKDVTWAHLDIAGTAWAEKERASTPKGATAFGVRLLDTFVSHYCEKQ